MNINALLLTFVLCSMPCIGSSSTLVHWNNGPGANNHYYLATGTASTWIEAATLAADLGGYLVSITSENEQRFLESSFLGAQAFNAYWIGLTDQSNEGFFNWISGESLSYTNWSLGEPNNFSSGIASGIGEDFAVFNWTYANHAQQFGAWNDTPNNGCTSNCTAIQPYRAIIEFNGAPNSVPIPGAVGMLAPAVFCFGAIYRRKRKLN